MTEKKKRQPTAWNIHVEKTQKENPNMKFTEVFKLAKTTYKK